MLKQLYVVDESYHFYREPNEAKLDQEAGGWIGSPDCWAMITRPAYETTGQDYIETFRDPAHLDHQKREWGKSRDLVSAERFVRGSIIGVIVIGDEKAKPHRRIMNVHLTSPKTLVTIACYASQTQFKMLQPEYEAIMHGVTFPE